MADDAAQRRKKLISKTIDSAENTKSQRPSIPHLEKIQVLNFKNDAFLRRFEEMCGWYKKWSEDRYDLDLLTQSCPLVYSEEMGLNLLFSSDRKPIDGEVLAKLKNGKPGLVATKLSQQWCRCV